MNIDEMQQVMTDARQETDWSEICKIFEKPDSGAPEIARFGWYRGYQAALLDGIAGFLNAMTRMEAEETAWQEQIVKEKKL